MTTLSLDDFIREMGLEGDARVSKAVEEFRAALPLASLRIAAKKTQAELAAVLNVSQAAVSKFEGRGDFMISTLYKYAKALGAGVELAVHLGEDVFGLAPYEDEGQLYFRLIKSGSSRVSAAGVRSKIRLLSEMKGKGGQVRNYSSCWDAPSRGDYASIPCLPSELAANDETQPLAA